MKDDKEVHELSFLFANSLYDIRMRSGEQTMPSRSHQHRNAHHATILTELPPALHARRTDVVLDGCVAQNRSCLPAPTC